ncbi:hypothetical protein HDE79_001628 [Rhodanobacter sp. MP1X3]|nr:hypothetical protein [Rhodanobacter sp. MP1X3]
MKKPVAKVAATKKPAAKPAAPKPAVKKVASSPKTKATPLKLPTLPEPEIHHISPAEAVEHIQALLEAKLERVRQGPSWPGAVAVQPATNTPDPHAPTPGAGGLSSEAAFGHALAHERGDQSKRKG